MVDSELHRRLDSLESQCSELRAQVIEVGQRGAELLRTVMAGTDAAQDLIQSLDTELGEVSERVDRLEEFNDSLPELDDLEGGTCDAGLEVLDGSE